MHNYTQSYILYNNFHYTLYKYFHMSHPSFKALCTLLVFLAHAILWRKFVEWGKEWDLHARRQATSNNRYRRTECTNSIRLRLDLAGHLSL